jgi:hypothetical protein
MRGCMDCVARSWVIESAITIASSYVVGSMKFSKPEALIIRKSRPTCKSVGNCRGSFNFPTLRRWRAGDTEVGDHVADSEGH